MEASSTALFFPLQLRAPDSSCTMPSNTSIIHSLQDDVSETPPFEEHSETHLWATTIHSYLMSYQRLLMIACICSFIVKVIQVSETCDILWPKNDFLLCSMRLTGPWARSWKLSNPRRYKTIHLFFSQLIMGMSVFPHCIPQLCV